MASYDSNLDHIDPDYQAKVNSLLGNNIVIFPETVIDIKSVDEFNQIIRTYKKSLFVTMIYTTNCPACKAFSPIFEQVQKTYGAKGVIFLKVNADRFPEIAMQFRVQASPTTIFIQNQKIVESQVGLIPPAPFRQLIDRLTRKGDSNFDTMYL